MITNALCCYPNVNGAIRNLSLKPPLPPFYCNSIISEKIFGLEFGFSFTFFLHICRTSWEDIQNFTYNHAFFLLFPLRPPKFWGRVEQIFQNGPANIWAHENWKQIFGYFKLRFHNELLHWQKNRFLVFFRAGLHLHVRKISTLSVKQFKLFAKISYFFDN